MNNKVVRMGYNYLTIASKYNNRTDWTSIQANREKFEYLWHERVCM